MVDERRLPDTGPGDDRNDIYLLICPCIIQESDILSRPKTSLPVTGNLATEIFLGPRLAGGLRVPAREAAGGILSKPLRLILRPASIRPVIVDIAFRSSPGF
jgi:hypothetical protein